MKGILFLILFLASASGGQANMLMAPNAAPSGACAQAETFLARTSGLDTTHQDAYTNTICHLVRDGIITGTLASAGYCGLLLDVFYIEATQDATTAALDICGHTAYTLTPNGSPAFLADSGWIGVDASTTVYLDTQYVPASLSGGNYLQNSAHISAWSLTNAATGIIMGTVNGAGTTQTSFYPRYADDNIYARINDFTSDSVAAPGTSSIGFFVLNRSGASAVQMYHGGNTTPILTSTTASNGTIDAGTDNGRFYILSLNGGLGGEGPGAALRVAVTTAGGSLTAAQQATLHDDICTYWMTPIHGSCP